MKPISAALPSALESLRKAPPQSSAASALTLKDDREGQKALAVLLAQSFDALNSFGKTPDQLVNAASAFRLVLSDFPLAQVETAFRFWLGNFSHLPTPAEIAQIIRRGGSKPPLEKSVYVNLSKKDPCERTRSEWAYMREFEDFQIRGDQ